MENGRDVDHCDDDYGHRVLAIFGHMSFRVLRL